MTRRIVLLLLAATIAGCSNREPDAQPAGASSAPPAASAASGATPTVEASLDLATDLGVRNARMPMAGVVTAGQPTQEQLEALRAGGYSRFISLRPASEEGAGWEEAHASDGSYSFDRLAISGGDDLTRENVEAFAALLEERGDEPTVLYCASSNRVGAMLALKAYWLDGASEAEALDLGREAGMTRLESRVVELMEGGR